LIGRLRNSAQLDHLTKRQMDVLSLSAEGRSNDRFASDYEDPRSAFDCAKMKALFGWTPRYSSRSLSC
jgi:hypothetical protein